MDEGGRHGGEVIVTRSVRVEVALRAERAWKVRRKDRGRGKEGSYKNLQIVNQS